MLAWSAAGSLFVGWATDYIQPYTLLVVQC